MVLPLLVVGGIQLVAGWFRLFSWLQFLALDDEGYMITTLQQWIQRGGLYDDVFSQYGPFYTLFFGAPLDLLGVEPTLATARALTLALIVASAAIGALAVLHLSRNVFAALIAQLGVFVLLGQMESAVLHPAALLMLLLALLVLNLAWRTARRTFLSDLVTGALTGAIILTKVNVGIFVVIAVAYLVATAWPDLAKRQWLRLGPEIALLLVGPVLLLQHRAKLDSVRIFGPGGSDEIWLWLVSYVAAAAAVVAAGRLGRSEDAEEPTPDADTVPPFSLLALTAGFLGLAGCIVVAVLVTGTSPGALVEGVVTRPSDFAGALTAIPLFPRASWAWIIALPVLILLAVRITRWPPDPRHLVIAAGVRTVAALSLLITALAPDLELTAFGVDFGWAMVALPAVALVLVPRLGERTVDYVQARQALAVLSVVHTLHAFPVAGVQRAVSLALPVMCGAILLADAGRELQAAATDPGRWRVVRVAPAALVFLAMAVPTTAQALTWRDRFREGVELGLPGSGSVRGAPSVVAPLRDVIDRLEPCDRIISYPGFGSFYGFTRSAPPTGYNSTLWEALLNEEEQRSVVRSLEQEQGQVCLFRLTAIEPMPSTDAPLVAYLDEFDEILAEGAGWVIQIREPL